MVHVLQEKGSHKAPKCKNLIQAKKQNEMLLEPVGTTNDLQNIPSDVIHEMKGRLYSSP